MSKLKKIITSKFASREGIADVRMKTARIFFVFAVLAFTLNYFLVGGGFFDTFLGKILPYTYSVFVLSFVFLIHLFITSKYLMKKPIILSIILFFILLGGAGALLAPLFLR